MAQRVMSISLGSEIVKVCEVALAGKKKVQIFNAIDLVIPEGICEDGVILDANALAKSILEGLAGEGFTAKKLAFSIASRRIASKEAVIPFCKEKQIADIVKVNASEYFPISNLEDYTVSYSILEVLQNESIKNYRLSVVATPNEMLSGYYELAKIMGMSIHTIDFSGNSILQVLKFQTGRDEVDAILQVGSESTVVNIMNGPVLVMQRSVPYGRNTLLEAVRSSRGVPESVADMMLVEEDISNLTMESDEVAEAVRLMFSSINRIVDFYMSRNSENPVQHVYMIGDVLGVRGLVELFDSEWDYDVQLIAALHGVEVKNHEVLSDEIASNYLSNIGALIAPMNIALVSEIIGSKKTSGMPWWILIFAGVIAIAMSGTVLYLHHSAKEEQDRLNRQIESYGDLEDLEGKFKLSQRSVEAAKNWYDMTKSANESLAKLMRDLEKVQPRGISINKLSSSTGNLVIEGTSAGKAPVAEYVIQLKKLDYITNVQTDFITEKIDDNVLEDSFSIMMTLKYDDPYAKEEADSKNADKKNEKAGDGDSSNRVNVVSEETSDDGNNERVTVESVDDGENDSSTEEEGGAN